MSINTPEAIKNFALKRWDKLAAKKYDAGQAAHGGLITERDSIADLEEEIIDAWFYIQAIRIKIGKINDL
jgi:hypothetical protein